MEVPEDEYGDNGVVTKKTEIFLHTVKKDAVFMLEYSNTDYLTYLPYPSFT